MNKFKETFLIITQDIDPAACLGLQWEFSDKGKRKAHNETCTKELISQLEKKLGQEIYKGNVSMSKTHHLELDKTALLDSLHLMEYQKLMGVLLWVQSSLRTDIALNVSSMSRRQCQLREGRKQRLLRHLDFLRNIQREGFLWIIRTPIRHHSMKC